MLTTHSQAHSTPRFFIGNRAWLRATMELDRVAPNEGLVVPLMALTVRDQSRNPCSPIRLADLGEITIASVVLVPDASQINSGARVSVRPCTDEKVNAVVERLTHRFPRLRACGHLHSHPFASGSTWPSVGGRCDYEGHMLPQLDKNAEAGLFTSFSVIACRSGSGRGWRFQCFALDDERHIVDCGFAERVADEALQVNRALQPRLRAQPLPRAILRHWQKLLRRHQAHVRSEELFDGWERLVVDVEHERSLVLLVPIDFPANPPRLFLANRSTRTSIELNRSRDVDDAALCRILAAIQKGDVP